MFCHFVTTRSLKFAVDTVTFKYTVRQKSTPKGDGCLNGDFGPVNEIDWLRFPPSYVFLHSNLASADSFFLFLYVVSSSR